MTAGKKAFVIATSVLVVFVAIPAITFTNIANSRKVAQAYQDRVNAHPLSQASILNDVNAYRVQSGVTPLSENPELDKSAQAKCSDMVSGSYYEHTRPSDGKKLETWLTENTKYWKLGNENLNKGTFVASFEVVDSWVNSPAHKAAMIDAKFTDTGIAICGTNPNTLVVQHFAAYYSPAEIQAMQPKQTTTVVQQPRRQTCYTNTYRNFIGNMDATTTCY